MQVLWEGQIGAQDMLLSGGCFLKINIQFITVKDRRAKFSLQFKFNLKIVLS